MHKAAPSHRVRHSGGILSVHTPDRSNKRAQAAETGMEQLEHPPGRELIVIKASTFP